MDALVIGGSVRRPMRFVMDHSIFKIPVLGFIFRTARAIPIAPAREDPTRCSKAFDRIDAELAAGELVCIFPEGKLTRDGEMNEFKRGVEKILERRRCPWCRWRCAACGAASSAAAKASPPCPNYPSRFWSRIELIATAPVPGDDASATGLQSIVSGLRADWQ